MKTGHEVMERNANRLMEHLEELYEREPDYGYYLSAMADDLNWSKAKTYQIIEWCRYRMDDPRYRIYAFRSGKDGRRWCYKKPDAAESRIYERERGRDIARRAAHTLLLVRKRASEFGVTRETKRTSAAYADCLRALRLTGVEEAEFYLAEAMRDLSSTNGHAA
jgi:hypothetical protein